MKVSGRMTKLMVMVNICMQMEQPILASGSRTNSKGGELRLGLMVRVTKANIRRARSMAKVA